MSGDLGKTQSEESTTAPARPSVGRVPALASLARIAIPTERMPVLEKEFDAIISYIDQLQGLEARVETSTPKIMPLKNVFREDRNPHDARTFTERITKAFPKRDGDALSVRKIISHD